MVEVEATMEPWIVSDLDTLAGKPRVRGTRLSVAFLIELVASGATREQILASYPYLPPEGLEAALRYAAEALQNDVVWDTRVPA
jgi:uncharacterized protein (DUF433 family)